MNLSNDKNEEPKEDKHLLFFRLYTRNQSQIFAYILTLIPNLSDSEDLFQDVSTAMWEHFDQYEPGTHFLAWARTIARNRIIDYMRKCGRSKICYSTETIELLSNYIIQKTDQQDKRNEALKKCLTKLSSKDRSLVKARYGDKITTKELADRIGRSVQGLYKSFARIHFALYECIQHRLATESIQ